MVRQPGKAPDGGAGFTGNVVGRFCVCLVVPCHNEAHRFEDAPWHALVHGGPVRLLFVDDGSRDPTPWRLAHLVRTLPPGRASVLTLPTRMGRGEAVRRGLLRALQTHCAWVGHTDADAATPASELLRLIHDVLPGAPDVVLGARVQRLGARVRRRPARRLLGRLFAHMAARALACDVYDTQCPAKFYRPVPALRGALERPFAASWTFDTELLARLLYPGAGGQGLALEDFLEVPLEVWRDVAGSKLTWAAGARAGADLLMLAWSLRRGGAMAAKQVGSIGNRPWRTWRSSPSAAQQHAVRPADAEGPG